MNEKTNLNTEEIGRQMREAAEEYDRENTEWWNSLEESEREAAFYAVCKRIWQADGLDRGSYRHALYSVFGFDPGMYAAGMECGYMSIHNAIYDGEDLNTMRGVDRLEIIDPDRNYVRYIHPDESAEFSLQDNNATLKIFIDNRVK